MINGESEDIQENVPTPKENDGTNNQEGHLSAQVLVAESDYESDDDSKNGGSSRIDESGSGVQIVPQSDPESEEEFKTPKSSTSFFEVAEDNPGAESEEVFDDETSTKFSGNHSSSSGKYIQCENATTAGQLDVLLYHVNFFTGNERVDEEARSSSEMSQNDSDVEDSSTESQGKSETSNDPEEQSPSRSNGNSKNEGSSMKDEDSSEESSGK
jgi:hypothetical protein